MSTTAPAMVPQTKFAPARKIGAVAVQTCNLIVEMQALYKKLFARAKRIEQAGEPTHIKANFVGAPKSIPMRGRF